MLFVLAVDLIQDLIVKQIFNVQIHYHVKMKVFVTKIDAFVRIIGWENRVKFSVNYSLFIYK